MAIEIEKIFGHTASILKNTNKLVACSKADWKGVQDNHLLLIADDHEYYEVIDKEQFFFIKDVTVLESGELEINENTNIRLSINDDIVFTHKEHELVDIASVENGGEGYEKGDILRVEGGVCKYNSFDEIDIPSEVIVEEVGESGEIVSLAVHTKGVYSKAPENESALLGGAGSGAKGEFSFNLLEDRAIEDRTVADIYFHGEKTRVKLNHELPPKVHEGKISVSKWQVTLHMNYPKDSRFNVSYRVVKNFTPYNKLPLLTKDLSAASPALFNSAVRTLDMKIKEQDDQIKELQDKVELLTRSIPTIESG